MAVIDYLGSIVRNGFINNRPRHIQVVNLSFSVSEADVCCNVVQMLVLVLHHRAAHTSKAMNRFPL